MSPLTVNPGVYALPNFLTTPRGLGMMIHPPTVGNKQFGETTTQIHG